MNSNVDFDYLANKSFAPGATTDDYERLFGAAFALSEWNFVARGESPNYTPHIAIFPDHLEGQPMIVAFTDTERLRRYAKEKNLLSASGEPMILSVPTASVLEYLEQFIRQGVHGIFFNPDTDSHGFFIGLQQLRPIKNHLDSKTHPNAKPCLAVDFTLTLMRLTQDGDYVESGDQIYRYFFAVPNSWKIGEYQTLAWQTAVGIYQNHYRHFRQTAPEDPNYINVKRTNAKFLTVDEIAAKPWNRSAPPIWESTNCLVIDESGQYQFVSTTEFETELE